MGAAGAESVEANTLLTHPSDEAVVPREDIDGCVGKTRAGAEHEHGDVGDGHRGERILLVENDGVLLTLDHGVLDVEVAQSVTESRLEVEVGGHFN